MKYSIRTAIFALGALALMACAGVSLSTWLKAVNFSTANNNGNVQVTLTAQMSPSEVSLAPIDFQFYNPDNSQLVASVDITNVSSAETDIAVTYDFTQLQGLTDLPTTTTLPNGTAVPVAGPNANWMVLKPSSSSSSMIYVNINESAKKAVIGYVLAANILNAGVVGDLMLNFNLTGLSGTGAAGLYSGAAAGTSGFAFFADISSVFGTIVQNALKITDATPDKAKVQIVRHLYDLKQKHAKIKIH